jgi:hypothetical protein
LKKFDLVNLLEMSLNKKPNSVRYNNKNINNSMDDVVDSNTNVDLFIQMLKLDSTTTTQKNSFTNKKKTIYHENYNFIYRIIMCYRTYIADRINNLNTAKNNSRSEHIWNFDKETELLNSYVKYQIEEMQEDPLPIDKFIFLIQFFLFCVKENKLKQIVFLIFDKECQDFFCNKITQLTNFIDQNQINKHNSVDVINATESFCNTYIRKMIVSSIKKTINNSSMYLK